MKTLKLTTILLALSFAVAGQSFKSGQDVNQLDSVILGPGYANEIYYSFENGVVSSVPRATWDIGFHSTVWSATIITNAGSGADLYTYPYADTSGWATVDTNGLAGWTILYDDENEWENGAFNRNAGGHPDYGWGRYNPITHDVVGDSLYILKARDGSFRKIWIQRKNSINNTYYLRYANLDGSNENTVELAINPYRAKNFVYYDLSAGSFVDREPDTVSWDVLFTRYMAIQPNGTPYPVIGVQSNFKVYANEFSGVGPDFTDWTSQPFDSTKSAIGWEWKSFDMNQGSWKVADSLAFFVQTRNRDVYKLVFTGFSGTTTGKIFFEKSAVSPSDITEGISTRATVTIFPNPVKDQMTIVFGQIIQDPVNVSVFDMAGKQVFSTVQTVTGNTLTIRFPEVSLGHGLHLIRVTQGTEVHTLKFMVSKF